MFDKNQSVFPSAFHREVWWWAIGMVPLSDSLTDDVKGRCSPEVLEGCHQWHEYFTALCEDMYNHENEYLPASARQYRDILEAVCAGGALLSDNMVWNIEDWNALRDKLNRSKAYLTGGVDLGRCLRALERLGLRYKVAEGKMVFRQATYPKVFHAMHTMERSPDIRNTPARHHFAHCEFRQLFKSYSANYDELLRRASDESLHIVHAIHDYCKTLKIQRYIHYGIIKYKYKGIRVLDFNLHGDEYPTLRINMGTCAAPDADIRNDEFYGVLLNQPRNVQDTFVKNLIYCDNPSHKHYAVVVNGREDMLCPCMRLSINPYRADLEALLALISARKASIDQHCG